MQETQPLFPQDLYTKHLSIINNIHFTCREIDVIACLLSARGTSKIAFFLCINPRTVETHIRNIMSKLECNTREGIIDFIEASGKLPLLRKYYSLLRTSFLFEKTLKDIAKLNQGKNLRCVLMLGKDIAPPFTHLKSHLNLAGIAVSKAVQKKEEDYVIFVLPKALEWEDASSWLQKVIQIPNRTLCLLGERKNQRALPKELMEFDILDFSKHENYFFSFLEFLKKILQYHNIDKFIAEFRDKYKKIHVEPALPKGISKKIEPSSRFVNQIKYYPLLIIFLIGGVCGSGFLAFRWDQGSSLRSDLILPSESVFLHRPELMAQIDSKFKGQQGIQTLALVGPGGAGKTTLARQYAHSQKIPIVWEINAETMDSLKNSFENLAQALSNTEEDKKILREIQEIRDSEEREKKIIQFVKTHLKSYSNWFLVYDNVEKFTDIQNYFPQDFKTWGQGKVILTTRDGNIQNNKYINNVIQIGELSPNQKLILFNKIVHSENTASFTPVQDEGTEKFLEEIPPFPLDISIAAYYLKAVNISYNTYLENLTEYNKDFAEVQQNILKESGDYTKTRYSIITLTLQHLINTHKDFKDLLLFVSFLNSQNIPRDLLNTYKNQTIVDNFIYNLKKYSIITNESSANSVSDPTFSIHRSIQILTLVYLTRILNLEKNSKFIQSITCALENYVNDVTAEPNFLKIKLILPHCKFFLGNDHLLSDTLRGSVDGKLGSIYYYLGDYKKAKGLLSASLQRLNNYPHEPATKIAHALGYLGNVYRELGNYEEAKNLLKKSYQIYKKHFSEKCVEVGWTLAHLGIVHRKLGNFVEAKTLLEKSLLIHKKHFPDTHDRMAWVLAHLGSTYRDLANYREARKLLGQSYIIYKNKISQNPVRVAWILAEIGIIFGELGNFDRAKKLLEQSLLIYKMHFSKNHVDVAWILAHLGSVYREAGDKEKAKKLLEQSLIIYKQHFPENHVKIAWVQSYLADVYCQFGAYIEAKNLLKKSLLIYEKNYGMEHIQTARILRSIGQTHLLEGCLENAENLLLKSLEIFQKNKHPEVYQSLESLGELYLKKSIDSANKGEINESHNHKSQATNYLNQSLEIVKAQFPKDSSHIIRIQGKLKCLSEQYHAS